MIVANGATGQLGRLVVDQLLSRCVPGASIFAAVRTPSKATDLAALGVVAREADYSRPSTLEVAFAGAERVLLISSSAFGQRTAPARYESGDEARSSSTDIHQHASRRPFSDEFGC